MPETDSLARRLPAGSDPASAMSMMRAWATSSIPTIQAASAAEMESRRVAYRAEGGLTPVMCYRTDTDQLWRHPNAAQPGDRWELWAGREWGLNLVCSRMVPPGTWTTLTIDTVARISKGMVTGADFFRIPEQGMWNISLSSKWVQGTDAGGRRLVRAIRQNDSYEVYRQAMGGEDKYDGSMERPLSAGEQILVQGWHDGNVSKALTVEVVATIKRSANWVTQ